MEGPMSNPSMGDLLSRIRDALDSSSGRLRMRGEWKTLDGFYRSHQSYDPSKVVDDDLLRSAEAELDLLELARAETDQAARVEDDEKERRLRADEELLQRLQAEAKTYSFLIVLSYVLPPLLLLLPSGLLLLAGAVPALVGLAKMRSIEAETEGRVWLVLRSRVDEQLDRVKTLHYVAIGALALTLLWTFVEMMVSG